MKHFSSFFICLVLSTIGASATPIRFAVLTDTHVSAPKVVYDTIVPTDTTADTVRIVPRYVIAEPLQALTLCAEDIAKQQVSFVLHAGDMTENGDLASLRCVKEVLDSLAIPYFVTSGNHETTWSRSALKDLTTVFDSVRFAQERDGLFVLGMNSGPILRMSDGHIAPADTLWARQWLDSLGTLPVIALTHYPLREGDVDNWYDLTNMLRQYNLQVIIGGHYHTNKHIVTDGINNVLCRSSLPDKQNTTGYTIVEIDNDEMTFIERRISLERDTTSEPNRLSAAGVESKPWLTLPFGTRTYAAPDSTLLPSYAINDSNLLVEAVWQRQLPVSFYATPVIRYGRAYVGDDSGNFYAFDLSNGRILWRYRTFDRIISTADVQDGRVVFASANGTIYCLSVEQGRILWRRRTSLPVTGSATIDKGMVYIGSSDSCFYALRLATGEPVWIYRGFGNYCIAKPFVHKNNVYVGAWDGFLYAFNKRNGKLLWRWSNGKSNTKLSPAAVWPQADDKHVYIAAPDRYLTTLDAEMGTVQSRTNRWMVRESIGMHDSLLFAKTMRDTIIAINRYTDSLVWATDAGYGYEHAPTQLVVKEGTLYVTTKNGLVTALNPTNGEILWQYKVGNSLLTTPSPISSTDVIIASSDGTITRLHKHDSIPTIPADTLSAGIMVNDTTITPLPAIVNE